VALRFDILTLFPEMFDAVLGTSILKLAREKGLVEYYLHDIRDYTLDKHRKVDDRPYGGGPGMVLCCDPVVRCVEAVSAMDERVPRLLLLTPQGRRFDQARAREMAACERIMLLCGHYEGFDERIREILNPDEISIGDYVLTGGELPAMVIVDAVVRLLPGALGHHAAADEDSFSNGLLDCPHYSRPSEYRGRRVPDVLLSGDHQAVEDWRRSQARKRTSERRRDLLETRHDNSK
jgi:tRNA (guanine37-N1)-methyltransferase